MINDNEYVVYNYYDEDLPKKLLSHFLTSKKIVCIKKDDKNLYVTYDSFLDYLNKKKNNFIIGEDEIVEVDDKLDITIERWNALYKLNDKIIKYLKSLNYKTIIVTGPYKEQISNELTRYGTNLNILCLNEDDIQKLDKDSSLIIDTNNHISELKRKIFNQVVFSLNELCENAEYYYFVNEISKNNSIGIQVFEFPDIKEFTNLTEDEKRRIEFDHHYRYYYERYKDNEEIANLLSRVLGNLFTDEFIESRNHMPNVYLKNGSCFLENSDNPYCMSLDGKRRTTNQPQEYQHDLNIFGPCIVFGALVDDENTIPSYLQRYINEKNLSYRVNNYGARAVYFPENVRSFDNLIIRVNDQFIFLVLKHEADKLREFGFTNITKLEPILNNPTLKDYFIDEPVHCNANANMQISQFISSTINQTLVDNNDKENEVLLFPKKRNIFEDNKYLKEYLEQLKPYTNIEGHKGCIIMNCNPFTLGHQRLIEYASTQVDNLFVLVVQEDKSLFKYEDRLEMVKRGCSGYDNVHVIPSGKILASAMLFPEYFSKEDNNDVEVDASLDREVFAEHIAPFLGITTRFLGEENFDKVTQAYNIELKRNLPLSGIDVRIIPRFKDPNGIEISAKKVRTSFIKGDIEELKLLVPESTIEVLTERYYIEDKSIKRKVLK